MVIINNSVLDTGEPKPLEAFRKGSRGRAKFNMDELREFSAKNPSGSFLVKDGEGQVVGILHASFLREWFLETKAGTFPNQAQDPALRNQSFRSADEGEDDTGEKPNTARPQQTLDALNALGLALTDHGHHWTKKERWLYGRARGWLTSAACGGGLEA